MGPFKEQKFDNLKFSGLAGKSSEPYQGIDVRGMALKRRAMISQTFAAEAQNSLGEEKKKLQDLMEDASQEAAAFRKACHDLEDVYRKMAEDFPRQILEIALLIAEKIMGRELQVDPNIVLQMASTILEEAVLTRKKTLFLNDRDLAFLKETRPEEAKALEQVEGLVVKTDGTLPRGSCLLETPAYRIDGGVFRRLDQVWQDLLTKTPNHREEVKPEPPAPQKEG